MSFSLVDAGSDPEAMTLQDLMHRLAREMRIAAAIADDCQDALGEDEQLVLELRTSIRLQGLDLLSQQLIEIGRVLDRLVLAGVDGEVAHAVLDDVRLSDLQKRLAGVRAPLAAVSDASLW